MKRVFITPKSEELEEAGALREDSVVEEDGEIQEGQSLQESAREALPEEDFKALWEALQSRPTETILEAIAEQFQDAPGKRRDVLTTWMAQELGYSRVWRRRSTLAREPLWDILEYETYQRLSARSEEALEMIGASLKPARTSMHPSAALATLGIWRNSEDVARVEAARERLRARALPDEPEWLFEVVGVFVDEEKGRAKNPGKRGGRSLEALIAVTLEDEYWEVAAFLSALALVHLYGRWYHSSVVTNIVRACDIASEQYPYEAAVYLQFLADAAMGGRLPFSWLERPVHAAVRLSVADLERQEMLRGLLRKRPFDADLQRLEELYEGELEELSRSKRSEKARRSEEAKERLLREVEETFACNPVRALKLMELIVMEARGRRVGSMFQRMRSAVEALSSDEEVDELGEWLIGLYVQNVTLEGHAVELVRRVGFRLDWTANPFGDRQDFEMYLIVSDYERAFEQLTCKFEGITLEHADKYAAARIKTFVKKRLDPSRLSRMIQGIFAPMEWLGSGLTEIGFIGTAIDQGMEHFEERVRRQDLRDQVVEEYRLAGVMLEDFEEIGALPVDRVEKVLKSQRQRRILLGAVAGGISGGLSPFSWGVLSLADIPVLLSMTADICSRFCWYFGFDPREETDIPLEILAVALGGTAPSAIEPMLVRQNLQEYVTRKSLVVGAVARGSLKQLTGRGLSRALEKEAGQQAASRVGELARRVVSRNLQERGVKAAPSKSLPVVGAVLGASLNVALIYDIIEAAQAVLTDRFLERKYPEWVRHIGGGEGNEEVSTEEL